MANTTYFLTEPAMEHIESMVVKAERVIDFTKQNVASGSTLDVFNVPAGAVILAGGVIAATGETSVTVTLGQDGDSGNDNIFGAGDVGTTGNAVTVANTFVPVYVGSSADVLRSVVGGANATTAVLKYWIIYIVIK